MNESFKTFSQEKAEVRPQHSEINFEIRREALPPLGDAEKKVSGYLSTVTGGVKFDVHVDSGVQILEVIRNTSQTTSLELTEAQALTLAPFLKRTDVSEVRIAKRDGTHDDEADAWVMKVKVGPIGEPTEQTKITLTQEQKQILFSIADVVEKKRYYLPVALVSDESVIVEVDEYPNGLWMAEVPVEAVDQIEKNMPTWLGTKITEADAKSHAWQNIKSKA